jgi:hypothetical protein
MKRWISAVMVVALLVSVAPVLAGESFHALRQLPASLTPLDDAQLATVEGGWYTNYAEVSSLVLVLAGGNIDIRAMQEGEINIGTFVEQEVEYK